MNKSIEQSLTGLLPSLNGPLPAELVNLAQSLLAQSRSKASTLKPEEEIARSYACAQIACDRLKKRLNLPTIASRPPCPPQAYKKLLAYLNASLPTRNPNSAPSTPQKRKNVAHLEESPTKRLTPSNRTTPSKLVTPSKRITPAKPITPAKRTPGKAQAPQQESETASDKEWARSIVRMLCREFAQPKAVPHVFAGLASVIELEERKEASATPFRSGRGTRRLAKAPPESPPMSHSRLLAYIACILFYVLARMKGRQDSEEEVTPEKFVEWRDKALSVFKTVNTDGKWNEKDIVKALDELLALAPQEGWFTMDWFLNINPPSEEEEEFVSDDDAMNGVEKQKRTVTATLDGAGSHIGLGTMMQDATDWLSEARKSDYLHWKAGIMARIEELEATQMDVDG